MDTRNFIEFLTDIRDKNYDQEFASFHASNLIVQEGIIEYDVNLDDRNTFLVLDFLVKLDAIQGTKTQFKRLIKDLIEIFTEKSEPEEIEILFILYKENIESLYQKYSENKISIESLRSALRRYCNRKDDFNKLIALARA